jgi:hypothetical protein
MSNEHEPGIPKRHQPDWVKREDERQQRYVQQRPSTGQSGSDVFETLVPTKNQQALMGYYIAVFSLIPVFGLGLGPIAIWRGIRGWNAIKAQPELPGKAHCIVAITIGSITTAAHWGALIFVMYTLRFSGR